MKRNSVTLILLILTILFASCSGTKISTNTSSLKKSKYFRILADADDDPIFVKLQDDLHIDPKMERYTITVDIRSNDEVTKQSISIGGETDAIRYSWMQVSEQVRKGLINWTGSNKENLDY